MQFSNVPPTADSLTDFAAMLLFDCEAVAFAFRNRVQPPDSQDGGNMILVGPNSDPSGIDPCGLDYQFIGDINRRTLPLVAPQVTKFILQGFEPWYWIAEQLKNHPWNYYMAGPFKPEDKDRVAEMLFKTMPPYAVKVEK